MADRVANTYRLCSALNGRCVKSSNCFRVCARSVFSDIHNGYTFSYCKCYRVFRKFQQLIECPVFRKETYGRRADEGTSLDGDSDTLRNLDNGQYVVAMSSCGTVRSNLKFFFGYLPGH